MDGRLRGAERGDNDALLTENRLYRGDISAARDRNGMRRDMNPTDHFLARLFVRRPARERIPRPLPATGQTIVDLED